MSYHWNQFGSLDTVLDTFLEIIYQNRTLVESLKNLTHIETKVKQRARCKRDLLSQIKEKDKTIQPNIFTAIEFIINRVIDPLIDPEMILELIKLVYATYTDMPSPSENSAKLLVILSKTHQYAFAEVECFMEVKTLFNGPKALLNCGLEIIAEIGSLLDEIVELESDRNADDSKNDSTDSIPDDSIVKIFCRSLKDICKGAEVKPALKCLEAISKGVKYGLKYGQPVVAQLFGDARRTIEKAKIFNEEYNQSVRMVGLCSSDAYDFNCDRIMTDYLLHSSFLKKPIPTQIAIIKCCERFTKGKPQSVQVIHTVHGMLFKILENDNTEETVKDAVALALIRTMAPRKMPKEIFRIAAFQIQGVSIHKKIVKYLKKGVLPGEWLSLAAVIVAPMEQKAFRSEFKMIFAKYRQDKISLPEHALPYMIDLWASCVTSNLKEPDEDTITTLKDIQIYIRLIIETMTLSSSYGLKPHQGIDFMMSQEMIVKSIKAGEYSKALSKSYGWLHGLATVCRRYLFDTSNLVLSRKIWLVSEMIDQEVVEQSAVSKQAPDNIDMRESITIFPKTLFQVIKGDNGQLRASEPKRLMPPQIKYEVLTPTKRNERRPKRNSSEFKSKKKLALGDNDEDDDENSDSDNEQNVEDENFEVTTLETSTTRSGRQVKQRVIQGTKESQKQNQKSKTAGKKPVDDKTDDSTDESDLENDAELNDLISTAKRKKTSPSTSSSTSNNKQKPASVSVETSEVTKGKKPPSQVSKRQTAKKEESPKKTSPARLAPKNKSKKEVPSRASPRGQPEKSTNQKRGKPESTRLDSPMANISIDDEKENKRSSPRKRNRDSSSGSQSSQSSQSSQKSTPKKGLKSGKQAKVAKKAEEPITKTRSGRTSKRAKT